MLLVIRTLCVAGAACSSWKGKLNVLTLVEMVVELVTVNTTGNVCAWLPGVADNTLMVAE